MKNIILALLSIILCGYTTCGGEDEGLTLEEKRALACNNMICWEEEAPIQCEEIHRLLVHSEACLDAIIEEDGCSWSSYALDICYPPCSDKPTTCSGDQLRECLRGRLRIVNCDALCAEMNQSYLGCGEHLGADDCLCSG